MITVFAACFIALLFSSSLAYSIDKGIKELKNSSVVVAAVSARQALYFFTALSVIFGLGTLVAGLWLIFN